ncbi:HNH endonuclease [Neptuniibacter halophilus]|uniref:HNH endonuclease signature motif containing protein n=1 Tax=Neptuniibacter halophilus TaxID=651666 RepID=UPI002573F4AC|nr:HNH endonuclease [Neptuniibacter halophilus]
MLLIGNWSDPIQPEEAGGVQVLHDFISRKGCVCEFCGTQTRLSAKEPLGHFHVCRLDRQLPNEPANWVTLCCICSDLNSLDKLKGKGSFIEAPWISQGQLTNLLRLAYAVSVRPEAEWGTVGSSASAFLNAIDSTPEAWASIKWAGQVESLQFVMDRMVHPFSRGAYANSLRFRFDLDPYEDAIRYWAVALEKLAMAAQSTDEPAAESPDTI